VRIVDRGHKGDDLFLPDGNFRQMYAINASFPNFMNVFKLTETTAIESISG
jgi:hypothetical protein